MNPYIGISFAVLALIYSILQLVLRITQDEDEPYLLESKLPFFDFLFGFLKHGTQYLAKVNDPHRSSVYTLRMPAQRIYVVHSLRLIKEIQTKANAATFIPNLLDFGMLFSGLNYDSKVVLRKAFGANGNAFTMSVHKHLLSGSSLDAATKIAVDRLGTSIPKEFADDKTGGLLDLVRHELTLAMTGAIYGPHNPFNDPEIEKNWCEFVPGISHLIYSPLPYVTARKALRARAKVIDGFKKFFESGGHHQASPMIPEMFGMNKDHGLIPEEAAKMEMATSLAMLSSGANTAFWLLHQIMTDPFALNNIRNELYAMSLEDPDANAPPARSLRLKDVKTRCHTLVAMLNETLRYHSTVINIKQVQRNTTLDERYQIKKDAMIMIPGQSVHFDKDVWGSNATKFDHQRFLPHSPTKNLASTSAFRPFGSGITMCPGRHFSTNVILGLVAMIVLQYDVLPQEGDWTTPTKRNADFWNAMPKPDNDIEVRLLKTEYKKAVRWDFSWD